MLKMPVIVRKKSLLIAIAVIAALAILIGSAWIIVKEILPAAAYRRAIKLTEAGEYEQAYTQLLSLGNYRDAQKRLSDFIVRYDTYTVTVKEADASSTYTYRYTYDEHGNPLKKYITTNGKETVQTFTYDEHQNRTYYANDDHTGLDTEEMTVYTYDEHGHILTAVTTDTYGGVEQVSYAYDTQGNLLKATKRATDGTYTEQTYFYDVQGTLVEVAYNNGRHIFYNDGNIVKEIIQNGDDITTCLYTYNKDGRLLSGVTDDSDLIVHCEYDRKGQLLVREYRNAIPSPKTEYTYNRQGQVIKAINQLNSVTEYTFSYDKHGNVVTETSVTSDNTETTHYTYDDCGNMIKKDNSRETLEVSGRRIFLRNSNASLPFYPDTTQEYDKALYVNDVLTSAYK